MVAMVQEPVQLLHQVRGLSALLASMNTSDWDALDGEQARVLLGELAQALARINAHQIAGARVVEKANLARKHGAVSTGDLLGRDLGNDISAGNRLLRAAADIAPASKTESALADGRLSPRQAQIIGKGLAQLPEGVTSNQRTLAEDRLIRAARTLRPKDLQRRADRITDQFLPKDDVDRTENDLLVAREKPARAKTRLELVDNRDGTHSGRFTIPDLAAAQLKAALQVLAAPRRDPLRDDAPTDFPHRMGIAFTELLGLLPTGDLPVHGGVSATVTVNIDLDALQDQLSVVPGTLTDGTRLSAGEVRRLACDAGVIPQILGGKSVPLDLGAERRLFSKHQRMALAHRDGGCSFPGMEPSHKGRSRDGRQTAGLVRSPSCARQMGRRRHHRPGRRSPALLPPSPHRPLRTLAVPRSSPRRHTRIPPSRIRHLATQPPLATLTDQDRSRPSRS